MKSNWILTHFSTSGLFGKRRRRRAAEPDVPSSPPTCSAVEEANSRKQACLYYYNECPCQNSEVSLTVDDGK